MCSGEGKNPAAFLGDLMPFIFSATGYGFPYRGKPYAGFPTGRFARPAKNVAKSRTHRPCRLDGPIAEGADPADGLHARSGEFHLR